MRLRNGETGRMPVSAVSFDVLPEEGRLLQVGRIGYQPGLSRRTGSLKFFCLNRHNGGPPDK
jgi:hypothetical protein